MKTPLLKFLLLTTLVDLNSTVPGPLLDGPVVHGLEGVTGVEPSEDHLVDLVADQVGAGHQLGEGALLVEDAGPLQELLVREGGAEGHHVGSGRVDEVGNLGETSKNYT